MAKVVIAYHSGFGHTDVMAQRVAEGVKAAGVEVSLRKVDVLDDALWAELAAADGIIFGTPTYMANVSAPFKAFMDASSKPWFGQLWKDKLAGGFTNSGGLSGDKLGTLQALVHFAAQHSMIWVSQGVWPSAYSNDGKGSNRLSSWLGAMAQSGNSPAGVDNPNAEDQASARLFGERFGVAVMRWSR
ncbi:MAG: flavodoxin family protein [Proteobacteria bacterium]|nr:flavodoxin family protein [Pseudomonadota bacterium]